jgi:hypothetical protein
MWPPSGLSNYANGNPHHVSVSHSANATPNAVVIGHNASDNYLGFDNAFI